MAEIVNPYIAGAPVIEKRMFFGREDVFEWIQNSLSGQYADHILVIHGQRRVGKTSVLKQLGNRLPNKYIPVFFDLQGRTHTTLDRFLWWLARETVHMLKQERNIEIPIPEKEDFAKDLEYFENQFLADVRKVMPGQTLLLTFDEFDNLDESKIEEELARPLIDYLRRLMGREGLNFIFSIGSSGRKLENMQAAYTNFFKTALYKKISFLSEEETRNLVTRPVEGVLEYERAAVDRVYSIASGHPYFTQLTCHELFARCQRTEQRKIAKSDVEAILEDVVERGTVNLKFVWDEASDIEKWSLTALAQLDKTDNRAVADYLRKQRVRFSETDLTSGMLHLREKDVLTPDNHFVLHLLKLWLQKNRPIEQAREELTEVNPIANRYIEIGLEFKDAGIFDKAISSFQEALAVAKDNLQAQVNIALICMDQKIYDKAIVEFEKALAMDDEDVSARAGFCEAHLALGDVARSKGRPKEAVQSYQRVLAINAEHTEARGRMAELSHLRAEKALVDGKDEEALSAFAEALKFTPEDPALIKRVDTVRTEKKAKVLAALLARSGKEAGAKNWEGAVKLLEEALSFAPEDASIQKKISEVKSAQEKARLDALLANVEAAVKSARWDEAIDTLTAMLAVKPDQAVEAKLKKVRSRQHEARLSVLKTQAQGLARAERFDEALAAWSEYLSHKPDDQVEVEEIVQHTRKVAKIAGDYTEAQEAIRKKHYGRAIELLQGIIAQDPAYKATTRLLVDAVQANKAIPFWRRQWALGLLGVLGAAVLIVLGALYGPKLWGNISAALQRTPMAEETQRPIAALPVDLVSLEPILAYMAGTSPDPEDDFSNANDSWDPLAEGVSSGNLIADGTLKMVLEAGTPTEKLLLSSPYLNAANFGLEFDFYFEGSTGDPTLGVGFSSTGDGRGNNFDANIGLESQNWFVGLSDNSIGNSGNIGESLMGQWSHLQLVFSGAQAVVFLNGKLLGHAEGIGKSGDRVWIYAATARQAKIWLDNIKFWDLDTFIGYFTVTSAEDSGPGTLRQALLDAQAGDTITFDPDVFPPNDLVKITLKSSLPAITQGYLTLDASNASVGVDGSQVGGEWTAGIEINSEHNLIKGLLVTDFSGPGILLNSTANFNIIGGDRAIGLGPLGEGNLFSGNSDGVALRGSDNVIAGNLIGTDITGFGKMGSRASGIILQENASRNTIGPNNIIAYNEGGCGIDIFSLNANANTITANSTHDNAGGLGICYTLNGGAAQYTYSTPPVILYFDLDAGKIDGQTCKACIVEIFSTDTQDGKIFEGTVTADEYGNFSFSKGEALTGPFLTATTRSPGDNTSEFSQPTNALSDIQIALDAIQNEAPLYETSFDTWDFGEPQGNAGIENGKLIVTSENQEHQSANPSNLRSDKFAVEFELRILDSGPEGHCVFEIDNRGVGESWRAMSFGFFSSGQASLTHFVTPDKGEEIAMSTFDTSKSNTFMLVILEGQIAAFVNGQMAYTALDPDGSTVYLGQSLSATYTIVCEYDNYKFWDFSGVDFNP
jgi:tetratricopeptide (TPR) repeat protein